MWVQEQFLISTARNQISAITDYFKNLLKMYSFFLYSFVSRNYLSLGQFGIEIDNAKERHMITILHIRYCM